MTSLVTDPAIEAFVTAAEPDVFRRRVGLSWCELQPDRLVQQLRPPREAMEPEGTFPVSLLATLADSTLGSAGAVTGRYNFAVTIGLRFELAGPLPDDLHTVLATSSVIQADREGSLVTAVLSTPLGVPIGFTSMRGLAVRGAGAHARATGPAEAASTTTKASPGENPPASIDDVLGVRNIEAIDGTSAAACSCPGGLGQWCRSLARWDSGGADPTSHVLRGALGCADRCSAGSPRARCRHDAASSNP